jgi:restriction system protein
MSQQYRQYNRRPNRPQRNYHPSNKHYNRPKPKPLPYRPGKQRQAGPQELFMLVGLLLVVSFVWAYQTAATDPLAQQILIILAAVLIIGGLGAVFYTMRMYQKRRALRALKWANVDVMDGFTFEQYVGAVMKSLGYAVQFTAQSGDFGVDILAKKDGERIAIQIKRSRNFIGLGAVQEVVAGMYHYKCDRSMVVTNSKFSDAAKALASSNNCQLVDRGVFGQWILAFQQNGRKA